MSCHFQGFCLWKVTPTPPENKTKQKNNPEETRMGACIIILCPLFLFFLPFFWCHLLTLWFTQDAYLFRSGFVSISDAVHCKTVNVRSLDPLKKGMMFGHVWLLATLVYLLKFLYVNSCVVGGRRARNFLIYFYILSIVCVYTFFCRFLNGALCPRSC